jgi:hypothetical protein
MTARKKKPLNKRIEEKRANKIFLSLPRNLQQHTAEGSTLKNSH